MTQSATPNFYRYPGPGGASFSFPYGLQRKSDLVVTKTDLTTGLLEAAPLVEDTDYTIALSGVGAVVTLLADLGDYGLDLRRELPLDQDLVLDNNGTVLVKDIERRFDRVVQMSQQQQEEIDRSFKLSPSATAGSVEAPSAEPGYALGWDALGNLTNVPNTGADQTLAWTAADNLIRSDLVNTASNALGPALVGYNSALAYPASTVGSAIASKVATADLASTSPGLGAALVGYLAPFTGAVVKTLHQILGDFAVSPVWFGADKTGVSDSTAAFTYAIATGRTVYVPKGIYRVGLDLISGAILTGDGPTDTILTPAAINSSCLRINASTALKEWIRVSNLSIRNPSMLTGCTGLEFKGVDVNSINDNHDFSFIVIDGFSKGIDVTGRLIAGTFNQVYVLNNTVGFDCNTDTVDVSFIFNTFINCYFNNNLLEGMKLNTVSLSNKFITCNWQTNNRNNVAGVPALKIVGARSLSFDTPYFENNGSGVALNAGTPLSNSIDVRITGGVVSQRIAIANGYFWGASVCIAIDASPIYSGDFGNNMLFPKSGGWSVYASVDPSATIEPIVFRASNMYLGTIDPYGAGLETVLAFEQPNSTIYAGTLPTFDLSKFSGFTLNLGSPQTISTINGRFAGRRMTIRNISANTVTVAAALLVSGADDLVLAGQTRSYTVAGYPNTGKLLVI